MQSAFLEVKGVRTNVVTYGRWVEEAAREGAEDVVLLIPGNPGSTDFYKMFMQTLHEQTGFPVWAVGYAGHETPKRAVERVPPWRGNERLFGLDGQLEHKIDFIKRYVPKTARLHLVGHSIGGYMCVELLNNPEINAHVASVSLLFPTLEKMAETPNGRFFCTFIRPTIPIILFFAWIFAILPLVIKNFLMVIYMRLNNIPKMQMKPIINLVKPEILRKVLNLAAIEMDEVIDRNSQALAQNQGKIAAIYGRKDSWTMVSLYEQLKSDFPEIKAELTDFQHTFVYNESRQVALKVAQWVK